MVARARDSYIQLNPDELFSLPKPYTKKEHNFKWNA
jgi:hypothetical protein